MNNSQNNSSSFLTHFSPIQEENDDDIVENNVFLEKDTTPDNFDAIPPDRSTIEKSTEELIKENWNTIDYLDIPKNTEEKPQSDYKSSKEILEKKESKEKELSKTEVSPTSPKNKPVDKEKIKATILLMQSKLNEILNLLDDKTTEKENAPIGSSYTEDGHQVVEGIFNGTAMIGPDGHEYSVPENYASKSRLVEGDTLKLTIKENGSFVYKQIKPTEKKRITGTLVYDEENDQWIAMYDGKSIKVLNASISFYKGNSGDSVVLLVPKEKESEWGAVENIIKKSF